MSIMLKYSIEHCPYFLPVIESWFFSSCLLFNWIERINQQKPSNLGRTSSLKTLLLIFFDGLSVNHFSVPCQPTLGLLCTILYGFTWWAGNVLLVNLSGKVPGGNKHPQETVEINIQNNFVLFSHNRNRVNRVVCPILYFATLYLWTSERLVSYK